MEKKTLAILAVVLIVIGIAGLVLISSYSPYIYRGIGPGGMMGSSMLGNMDRNFIEQMIPHHDDAILMAEIALKQAEHAEIKTLAENIRRTQSEENAKMRGWYKSWYGTDVPEDSLSVGM